MSFVYDEGPMNRNVKDIMNRVHHIHIPNVTEETLVLMQKDVRDKLN